MRNWSRSNRLQPPRTASSTVTIWRYCPSAHSRPGARLLWDRSMSTLSALLRPRLNSAPDQNGYLVGTDENVLVLNRTYANRSNAERAAKMQWERLQRGVASFSLQLAEGRAELYTEMPVKVTGFKQPIDDAEWTITTLTHSVSPDNGFTTSMELEVKIDGLEIE
ncbi:hypothetical protein LO05_000523 [Salmonella enterica subsp. enterica]|nr:hypothetical protein [Salmonella enterica]EDW0568025.1 hypothetical protein [Salmonella enterica subsp. enterica]